MGRDGYLYGSRVVRHLQIRTEKGDITGVGAGTGAGGEVTRHKHKTPTILPLRPIPRVPRQTPRSVSLGSLPGASSWAPPFLPLGNRSGFYICGGFFFLLFCTKINRLLGISFALSLSLSLAFFFVFSTFHRSWLQLVNMVFLN